MRLHVSHRIGDVVRTVRGVTPLLTITLATALASPLAAQVGRGGPTGPQEPIDTAAIERIRQEGLERSQVMEITSWLTDVHSPRLTGSPLARRAGDWVITQFEQWGLENSHYEWWGPFGRGWVNDRTHVQVLEPVAFPVIAHPGAWTDGTKGPVSTDVVYVPSSIRTAAEFAPFRGKLKGKIVVSQPAPTVAPLFTAPGSRYTKAQLDAIVNPYPLPFGRGGAGRFVGQLQQAPPPAGGSSPVDLNQCFIDEGVAAVLRPGTGQSHGGNVFVGGGGSREANAPRAVPLISLAQEHYGRIFRILEKGVPVKVELDVKNTFYTDELRSFNLMAEIPGTDKADEVVLLGGHFDTWHAGTGATDNGAGTAIMMEAMRILKVLDLPLRRTVRIGLWMGEEQGLIGSREYVAAHYADRATMALKPDHAKLSAYFNVDNGGGAIRGIYLQGNDKVGPIFAQWLRALNSDSITTYHVAGGNTTGTDHQSFDAVGLPGFQFIQDPLEYGTRTHHASMDVYERLQAMDMKHNAVVVAVFAYLAANRDELLPREALPVPVAGAGAGGFAGRPQLAPVGCPSK